MTGLRFGLHFGYWARKVCSLVWAGQNRGIAATVRSSRVFSLFVSFCSGWHSYCYANTADVPIRRCGERCSIEDQM